MDCVRCRVVRNKRFLARGRTMMSRVLRGLVLMAVFGFWQTGTADAARYVPIEVLLYGEVILSGNASDNGRPDADEVWMH